MSQVVSAPAKAGKPPRPCARCGKNFVKPPSRICNPCQKSTRRAAYNRRGRKFHWIGGRMYTPSAPISSISITANGVRLRGLAEARKQTGECQFCGLSKCACPSSRIRLHDDDDRCDQCGMRFEHCRCGYPAPEVMA